jgi:hypothetical protein
VRFDISCNHNLVCYCAMHDYADTKARQDAQDAAAWSCILGPPSSGLNRDLTLALATAVNALDGAAGHIVELLSVMTRAKGGQV